RPAFGRHDRLRRHDRLDHPQPLLYTGLVPGDRGGPREVGGEGGTPDRRARSGIPESVTPFTFLARSERDHRPLFLGGVGMARQYKLRLSEGTLLGVDLDGLRAWLHDSGARVQRVGSVRWLPLSEMIAIETAAAAVESL